MTAGILAEHDVGQYGTLWQRVGFCWWGSRLDAYSSPTSINNYTRYHISRCCEYDMYVRHVVRPDERHAVRCPGGGANAGHRGCAKRGGGHRTRDVRRRLARQFPAAGAAGAEGVAVAVGTAGATDDADAAGAAGIAGAAGTAGATNDVGAAKGPACNDAVDVAGPDDAVAAGGDVAVIPARDR